MSFLTFIFKVSRPRFWIYVFGPFIIGAITGANSIDELSNIFIFLFACYFLFPANILIYGINDIFDYETDKFNAKKDGYEVLVEPDHRGRLVAIILLTNIPFIALSLYLGFNVFAVLCGFLFFSCFYSAPPIRAKSIPLIDSIFNILYVFPAILGFVLVSNTFPSFTAVLAAGFWTMAMHAYSAIPDIEADKQANLSTIATKLGSTGTLIFCLICYLLSSLIAFQFLGIFSLIIGAVYIFLIFISFRLDRSNSVFKAYRFFPLINSLVGFVLFWYIALTRFDVLQLF